MPHNKMNRGRGPAKILIVDDHPVVREGLAVRIARQPDLEVCGEAEDVAEALRQVSVANPDLVIVDISLKEGSGIELIKEIRARDRRIKMLVVSMYDESLYAERALGAGALGYINKQEAATKVIDAIHQVLGGEIYLSAGMTDRILHRAVDGRQPERSSIESLTDRELEIFRYIGLGLTIRQIAEKIHRSVKTVEAHRDHIKTKLNLKNSTELIRSAVHWVLENG